MDNRNSVRESDLQRPIHSPSSIKRNCIVKYFSVACLLAISSTLALAEDTPSSSASGAASSPNIIIMLADDLGWGDVGYHGGSIKTPHIDRLASEGAQLDQFYVQSVCTPTRAALLTGRYPIRLGLQCNVVRPWAHHGLPLDEQTLPSVLKEVGYATAIVGKWHLGHSKRAFLPTQRGFDSQYGHYNGALDYFSHVRDGGHDWHRDDQANYDEGYTTDLIGAEAVRIIEEHDKKQPLFLYVPFNAPHGPYQAPEDQLERNKHVKKGKRRTFAAMVSSMDDAIGRIVSAAWRNLPQDNTLFLFCSDNGGITAVGSNGELRGQKSYVYEGGVRSPAIMAWKGKIKAGSIVREPLHISDLYPTILGLTGRKSDQQKSLDGKDAWATIANGQPTPHEFILLDSTPFRGAIRLGDWKLVRNGAATAIATTSIRNETWELFDLKNDPFETTNLMSEHPEVFEKLRSKLAELSDHAVVPNMPPNKQPADFEVPKVWGHPVETL